MKCKCEHWQICPVCCPSLFDAAGNRVPPKPCFADRLEMLRQRFEAVAKQEAIDTFWWRRDGYERHAEVLSRSAFAYQQCADELARVLAGETPPAPGVAWETKEKPE